MSTWWPLRLNHVHAVAPEERLHVSDRSPGRNPTAGVRHPTTTGIYDESTGRLFSLDSLGAILSELTRHLLESALVYHVDPWPRCQRCDRPACSPLTCRPPAAASTAFWRSCARSGMPSPTSPRATRRSTTSSSSWSLRLRTDVATGGPRRSLKEAVWEPSVVAGSAFDRRGVGFDYQTIEGGVGGG
jgi:hypothetical protein